MHPCGNCAKLQLCKNRHNPLTKTDRDECLLQRNLAVWSCCSLSATGQHMLVKVTNIHTLVKNNNFRTQITRVSGTKISALFHACT